MALTREDSIEKLNISEKAKRFLQRNHIYNIGEMIDSCDKLVNYKNIMATTRKEIMKALGEYVPSCRPTEKVSVVNNNKSVKLSSIPESEHKMIKTKYQNEDNSSNSGVVTEKIVRIHEADIPIVSQTKEFVETTHITDSYNDSTIVGILNNADENFSKIPIEKLNLSESLYNSLKSSDFDNLGDIINFLENSYTYIKSENNYENTDYSGDYSIEELIGTPIENLGLSDKSSDYLKNNNIHNVGDLLMCSVGLATCPPMIFDEIQLCISELKKYKRDIECRAKRY